MTCAVAMDARVADSFRPRYERPADLLDTTEAEVLADFACPREQWRQIWSNSPIERASSQSTISA